MFQLLVFANASFPIDLIDSDNSIVFDAEIPLVNFLDVFEMYFNKVTIKYCEMLDLVKMKIIQSIISV